MATVITDPYTARPTEPIDPTWDPNCPGCRSGVDPTWDPNCPGCLSGIGPDPDEPIKFEEDISRTA